MGLLGRSILREIISGAFLGTVLFTFVLFLQRVNLLFEQLVRGSASISTVGYLLMLIIPFTLTFTLPLGVLAGVLIALSRMSSDGEITAMRAAGIPSRKVLTPVILFSVFGMFFDGGLFAVAYAVVDPGNVSGAEPVGRSPDDGGHPGRSVC